MILLLLSLAALADGVRCVATDGSGVAYEEGRYVGGTRPGPDTAVHWERWSRGDERLHEVSTNGDGEVEATGHLRWTWDDAGKTVLSVAHPTETVTVTAYTTTVTLSRRWCARATVPMRCEETVDHTRYP